MPLVPGDKREAELQRIPRSWGNAGCAPSPGLCCAAKSHPKLVKYRLPFISGSAGFAAGWSQHLCGPSSQPVVLGSGKAPLEQMKTPGKLSLARSVSHGMKRGPRARAWGCKFSTSAVPDVLLRHFCCIPSLLPPWDCAVTAPC